MCSSVIFSGGRICSIFQCGSVFNVVYVFFDIVSMCFSVIFSVGSEFFSVFLVDVLLVVVILIKLCSLKIVYFL